MMGRGEEEKDSKAQRKVAAASSADTVITTDVNYQLSHRSLGAGTRLSFWENVAKCLGLPIYASTNVAILPPTVAPRAATLSAKTLPSLFPAALSPSDPNTH